MTNIFVRNHLGISPVEYGFSQFLSPQSSLGTTIANRRCNKLEKLKKNFELRFIDT